MKYLKLALFFTLAFLACKGSENRNSGAEKIEYTQISKPGYEIHKPKEKCSSALVLFGGFGENTEDIKREFEILDEARKNRVAVVFTSINRKLWLEEIEKREIAEELSIIFEEHDLPTDNIYFGGFSSGGNVAMLLGDFINESDSLELSPTGIFIVDSPIDLVALYNSSVKNIERDFSQVSVQESKMLMEMLTRKFGNPDDQLAKYEDASVYTSKTGNIDNIENLKNTKIRLYTEPDTTWWQKNRMADYDQLNAFYLKALAEELRQKGFEEVEFIPSENRGYRANGERHPHSWSLVEPGDLVDWMVNSKEKSE